MNSNINNNIHYLQRQKRQKLRLEDVLRSLDEIEEKQKNEEGTVKENKEETRETYEASFAPPGTTARLQLEAQKNLRAQQKRNRNYSYKWTKKPGDYGFNRLVTSMMRERGLFYGDRLKTSCTTGPFAHTISAAWLAGPETPIDRMLVIHRTGSGKTFAMIHILNNYFSDPRPKIVVFPNQELVRNFYEKMKRTPSQYSAFVQARADQNRVANTMTYFRETLGMQGETHKRGLLGELAAPIRPLSYSICGGRQVFSKNGGRPDMPIFRMNWDGRNPFDNKIILMDEVHNLIRPPAGTDKRLATRLERMRNALFNAQGSVIIGLTATPFVKDEQDGRELLKMIKGKEYQNAPTNEGFISYFNSLPTSIYPKMIPEAMTINITVRELEGMNLKKYMRKYKDRSPLSTNPTKRTDQLFKLMNYCNMAGYYTQGASSDFRAGLRKDPVSYATKFHYIINEILNHDKKSAVLVDRRLGFSGFKSLVKIMDPQNKGKWEFMGKPKTEKERKDNPLLRQFNDDDNSHGQKIRCLVLDAQVYGEGIDLLGVRFFYMANPAPSYAAYKQWEGRVLRACGYSKLSPSERNVAIEMVIARGPEGSEPTADQMMFETMKQETLKMEKAMVDIFGSVASDRIILGLS